MNDIELLQYGLDEGLHKKRRLALETLDSGRCGGRLQRSAACEGISSASITKNIHHGTEAGDACRVGPNRPNAFSKISKRDWSISKSV